MTGAKFSYCPLHLAVPSIVYKPIVQYDQQTQEFSAPAHDIFVDKENQSMLLSNAYDYAGCAGISALKDMRTYVLELRKRSANSSTVILQTRFSQVKSMVW